MEGVREQQKNPTFLGKPGLFPAQRARLSPREGAGASARRRTGHKILSARRKPMLLEQFPEGKPAAVRGMRWFGWKKPREGWLQDRAADASRVELLLAAGGPWPASSVCSLPRRGHALVWLYGIILAHPISAPGLPALEGRAFASESQRWYQALRGFNPEPVAVGCLEVGCDLLRLPLLRLRCSGESPKLLG